MAEGIDEKYRHTHSHFVEQAVIKSTNPLNTASAFYFISSTFQHDFSLNKKQICVRESFGENWNKISNFRDFWACIAYVRQLFHGIWEIDGVCVHILKMIGLYECASKMKQTKSVHSNMRERFSKYFIRSMFYTCTRSWLHRAEIRLVNRGGKNQLEYAIVVSTWITYSLQSNIRMESNKME